MEQNTNPYKLKYKYAADYGLILGAYIAIFYCLQVFFNANVVVNLLNTAGMIGTPFLCYYLTKKYRDSACGGYIRYSQAWSFGVWLFLFAGLIMSVIYFVHMQWIEPNFIADTFNQSLLMLEQMNYDQKALDAIASNPMPTPIQVVTAYLFFYIIGGGILFLIISAFIVRKNPDDPFGTGPADTTYKPYQDKNDTPDSNA